MSPVTDVFSPPKSSSSFTVLEPLKEAPSNIEIATYGTPGMDGIDILVG